jgi:hypothetical protein
MHHPLTGALIIGLMLGFGIFAKYILRDRRSFMFVRKPNGKARPGTT